MFFGKVCRRAAADDIGTHKIIPPRKNESKNSGSVPIVASRMEKGNCERDYIRNERGSEMVSSLVFAVRPVVK